MYSRETNLDKSILLVHRLDYIPCSFFVVVNHCLLDELYIMALAMEYRRIKKGVKLSDCRRCSDLALSLLVHHFPFPDECQIR